MQFKRFGWRVLSVCVACLFLALPTLRADEAVVENPNLMIKYSPLVSQRPLAEQMNQVLDQFSNLKFRNLPLTELIVLLKQHSGLPVMLDQQSFSALGIDPKVKLEADVAGSSLRGVLYAALTPKGLEAVIENDLLMIKVNYDAYARMGGKTTQWVSVDDQNAESLIKRLGQRFAGNYNQIPLADAVKEVSNRRNIPMMVNRRALEDLGLTVDLPVTINVKDVTVLEFITLMLRNNDLTLQIRDGLLEITTMDDAYSEQGQSVRRYWLDGTGADSADRVLELIVATMSPEQWEVMGGPSTIVPFQDKSGRLAVVVRTDFLTHLKVGNLLNSLRGLPNEPARIESMVPDEGVQVESRQVTPRNQPASSVDPFGRSEDDPFGGS